MKTSTKRLLWQVVLQGVVTLAAVVMGGVIASRSSISVMRQQQSLERARNLEQQRIAILARLSSLNTEIFLAYPESVVAAAGAEYHEAMGNSSRSRSEQDYHYDAAETWRSKAARWERESWELRAELDGILAQVAVLFEPTEELLWALGDAGASSLPPILSSATDEEWRAAGPEASNAVRLMAIRKVEPANQALSSLRRLLGDQLAEGRMTGPHGRSPVVTLDAALEAYREYQSEAPPPTLEAAAVDPRMADTLFQANYIEGRTFELLNLSDHDVQAVAGVLSVLHSSAQVTHVVADIPLTCDTPIPAGGKAIAHCDEPIYQDIMDILTGATDGHSIIFVIESITYADP